MATFGLTDTGLDMPRLREWEAIIRDDFDARLTARGLETPDWDNDTFLGDLVAVLAARLDELSDAAIQIDAGYDPNNAVGVQLENLCALIGVTRREATYSTVELECIGTNGTDIPAGTTVVRDDEGNNWVITEDGTIGDDGSGRVFLDARAEERGEITAPASTITTIVTPISGWDTVENLFAATPGEPRETDAELRSRRVASLQRGTTATVAGIRAAVFDLDWTTAVTVVDNPTNASATVEGISMNPHSVAVVVYPNSPTADEQEDLVEAIAETVPAGIEMMGSETDTYTVDPGFDVAIAWRYAGSVTTDVTVDATAEPGYDTAELEAGIEEAITDYFLSLDVGDDTRALPLYALINAIEGVDTVTTLEYDDGTTTASDIERDATEIAIEGTVSVTVT